MPTIPTLVTLLALQRPRRPARWVHLRPGARVLPQRRPRPRPGRGHRGRRVRRAADWLAGRLGHRRRRRRGPLRAPLRPGPRDRPWFDVGAGRPEADRRRRRPVRRRAAPRDDRRRRARWPRSSWRSPSTASSAAGRCSTASTPRPARRRSSPGPRSPPRPAIGTLTLPQVRFVLRPDVPPHLGTERIGETDAGMSASCPSPAGSGPPSSRSPPASTSCPRSTGPTTSSGSTVRAGSSGRHRVPGHARLLHEPRGVPRPERQRPPRRVGVRRVQAADGRRRRRPGLGSAPTSRRCWPPASAAPSTSLRRMLGDAPDGLSWATEMLHADGRRRRPARAAPCSPGCSASASPTTRWARSGGPPTSCASTAATATSRRGSTPTSTPARSACSPTRGAASR